MAAKSTQKHSRERDRNKTRALRYGRAQWNWSAQSIDWNWWVSGEAPGYSAPVKFSLHPCTHIHANQQQLALTTSTTEEETKGRHYKQQQQQQWQFSRAHRHMYPADIQPILAQSHLRPYGVHRSPSPTFPNHPARPQPTTQYTKGIRLWKRLLSPLTRGEHSPSTVSRIRCYLCFEAVSISLTPPSPSPSSSSDGTKPACLPVEHRRRICRGGSSKRGCLFRVDIPLVRLLVRRRWQ